MRWLSASFLGDNRGVGALLVALVFLAAQLAAPSGFMPVRTAQGIVITMCTGAGAVKMRLPVDGQHSSDQKQDDAARGLCTFAGGASAPALPAQPPILSLPVWHLPTGPIAFALKTGWIARLAAPPPPASGPPALLN